MIAGRSATGVVRALIRDVLEVSRAPDGARPAFEQMLGQAATLWTFISSHTVLLGRLCNAPPRQLRELARLGLLARSFFDVAANKSVIEAAFADAELLASCNLSRVNQACAIATNGAFWKNVEILQVLLEPLAACLSAVDSQDSVLSHSYKAFRTLREHTAYTSSVHGLPSGIQSSIRECVEARWRELRASGLAGVAFLLDPHCDIGEFAGRDLDTATNNAVSLAKKNSGFSDNVEVGEYPTELEEFAQEKAQRTQAEKTKPTAARRINRGSEAAASR